MENTDTLVFVKDQKTCQQIEEHLSKNKIKCCERSSFSLHAYETGMNAACEYIFVRFCRKTTDKLKRRLQKNWKILATTELLYRAYNLRRSNQSINVEKAVSEPVFLSHDHRRKSFRRPRIS